MNKHPRLPPSVFDATFRYRPSGETNIRLTFKRIRRELADSEEPKKAFPENIQSLPLRKEQR